MPSASEQNQLAAEVTSKIVAMMHELRLNGVNPWLVVQDAKRLFNLDMAADDRS